jgi:hypothetical protein
VPQPSSSNRLPIGKWRAIAWYTRARMSATSGLVTGEKSVSYCPEIASNAAAPGSGFMPSVTSTCAINMRDRRAAQALRAEARSPHIR